MALDSALKKEIISKFGKNASDTASAPVQIALISKRLEELNTHFKVHKKDHTSRRGLLKIVGQRKKLLAFYAKKDPEGYKKLIVDLGIRR